MSMIWAGAVEIALAWAVILGVKIASNAFEWKFEHLFHFTNLKLSEKNEKKKDFRHWSDAGREWREVIVEASVSDKYLSKDKKKVLHETIYP